MAFDLKSFARFTWLALFKGGGTNYRLTPKRIGRAVVFYTVFFILEPVLWFSFLLDDVLFKGYRQEEIKEPVFIVGNPRSGTTFLQRLLAKDEETFTCMTLWEALLAPSVTQRRLMRVLGALDRRLGSPLQKLAAAWERRRHEKNQMHEVTLQAPEEDQYLLLHIWSTLAVWVFSAILEGVERYTYFDAKMPPAEKERIMTFYRRCVQRHLYAHGGDEGQPEHYLSKNPSASPKIDTLYERFPDAKVIYLVRNPLDMIPSYISLLDYTWRIFGDPVEAYGGREFVLDMARHWYSYPLKRLERASRDSYIVVNFNDLVSDAEAAVTEIYDRFGFQMSPAFAQLLAEETEKARRHESEHEYSLKEMGLARGEIVEEFRDVFDRFGFDTRDDRDQMDTRVDGQPDLVEESHPRQTRSSLSRSFGPA